MIGRTSRHHSNSSMPTKDDFLKAVPNPRIQIPNKTPTSLELGCWDLEFPIRLFRERIDSFGQTKIKLGQSAFAVR